MPVLKWRCFKAQEKTILLKPKGKLGLVRSGKSNVDLACVSCRKPGLESKATHNHLRGYRDGTFSASPGRLVLEATPKEGW